MSCLVWGGWVIFQHRTITQQFRDTCRNQEDVEQLKLALIEQNTLMASYASATEHSGHVIDAIQQALLDLILMLQEVDEFIDDDGAGGGVRRRRTASTEADGDGDFELADLLSGNVDDVQLLRVRRILI